MEGIKGTMDRDRGRPVIAFGNASAEWAVQATGQGRS